MLDLIDQTLEVFFRATVPLSAQDVDVSFEAPDREWSAKLNRPTVNLFLWDIRRSTDRARTVPRVFTTVGSKLYGTASRRQLAQNELVRYAF